MFKQRIFNLPGHSNGVHSASGVTRWKFGKQMQCGPGFLHIFVQILPIPSGLAHVYVLQSFGAHSMHLAFARHLTLAQVKPPIFVKLR